MKISCYTANIFKKIEDSCKQKYTRYLPPERISETEIMLKTIRSARTSIADPDYIIKIINDNEIIVKRKLRAFDYFYIISMFILFFLSIFQLIFRNVNFTLLIVSLFMCIGYILLHAVLSLSIKVFIKSVNKKE